MIEAPIVFLTGLHRSGTSPLYRLLSTHPDVSGFSGTGVPEDEGQHLQSTLLPAKAYGGPGRFAFDARSYLDESSPTAQPENATAIWEAWKPWWDTNKAVLLEKSPVTIVRLRLFRKLFPASRAVVLVRNPLVVAKATQKWTGMSLTELILHWCVAHERLCHDLDELGSYVLVLNYEDLAAETSTGLARLCCFLGISPLLDTSTFVTRNPQYELTAPEMDQIPIEMLTARFGDLFRRFGYELLEAYRDSRCNG